MMSCWLCLLLLLYISSVVFTQVEGTVEKDLTKEPGHLKKFGSGRPTYPIDEIEGFPDTETFFKNYVLASRPLKMKGAARLSPAYHLWTDEYFLSLDIDPDSTIIVEENKKENRSLPVRSMHFQKFVRIYNNSDIYMVQDVPSYLKKDVKIPCCIQCPELFQDSFTTTIHLKTDGAYPQVDVDRVDYTQNPELSEVEYHKGNMTAGDCLYIPFLWIHQVRSYGSNLAVNIWWNNSRNHLLDLSKCLKQCKQDISLADVNFKVKIEEEQVDELSDFQDRMLDFAELKDIDLEDMKIILLGEELRRDLEEMNAGSGYIAHIKKIFKKFDLNNDWKINEEEVKSLSDAVWEDCMDLIIDLSHLIDAIEKASKMSHEEL